MEEHTIEINIYPIEKEQIFPKIRKKYNTAFLQQNNFYFEILLSSYFFIFMSYGWIDLIFSPVGIKQFWFLYQLCIRIFYSILFLISLLICLMKFTQIISLKRSNNAIFYLLITYYLGIILWFIFNITGLLAYNLSLYNLINTIISFTFLLVTGLIIIIILILYIIKLLKFIIKKIYYKFLLKIFVLNTSMMI